MTKDELISQIGNVTLKDLVCQKDIKTKDYVLKLQKNSYMIETTAQEFSQRFPLLPMDKIFYGPQMSIPSLYFNPDTLAITPIMISFLLHPEIGGKGYSEESFLRAIRSAEDLAEKGDYGPCGVHLPDAAKMEYLNLLVQKRQQVPNLYNIFLRFYRCSDYGFALLRPETLNAIIKAKTVEEWENTRSELKVFPDKIKIFRGGNTLSQPYQSACSWTTDINMANFFATRLGKESGYIACATVGKEDVLETFLDSSEKEILVMPNAKTLHISEVISVKGLGYIDKTLPIVTNRYLDYRDKLSELDFAMDSALHGELHEARVMLLCLLLAREMDLTDDDMDVLCTAAIYHDTGRENDWEDAGHGMRGCQYYVSDVSSPDPFAEFLCTYHCLPDNVGYRHIAEDPVLSKHHDRAKLLFNVFKDADALDRVRFGSSDLDLTQLRCPVSKTMTLVAKLTFQNLR